MISICLAFSALYEIVEVWIVLLFYPDQGPQWLGLQGDPYDAQWDMSMALLGAILAQVCLGRLHDRSIRDQVPQDKRQEAFCSNILNMPGQPWKLVSSSRMDKMHGN